MGFGEDMGQQVLRCVAIALIVVVCGTAGASSLPVILATLGQPLSVRLDNSPLLAAVVLEPDGRIVVHMSAFLMHIEDRDVVAFLYLHEVGHARLGHLLPLGVKTTAWKLPELQQRLLWQLEYDADRWAGLRARRAGFDPVRGLSLIFTRWGEGGGTTHPPDADRLARIAGAAMPTGGTGSPP